MKRLAFLAILSLGLAGCNIIPQKMEVSDPRVQPLLKAAAAFPRDSYGFSPLPSSGIVRLESRPTQRYDAMLHLGSRNSSRTIAFRKVGDGYKWIAEQEIFSGPHQYKTADGIQSEKIVLTYEVENVSGVPPNRLQINYEGDRQELQWPKELKLPDIQSELCDWTH